MHLDTVPYALLGLALGLAPAASVASQDTLLGASATSEGTLPASAPASAYVLDDGEYEYARTATDARGDAGDATNDAPYDDDAKDGERPFAIGLSGLVGLRDAGDDVSPTWTSGLDLALRVAPWVRVAVRRIGYGHASTLQGGRDAIEASPALDLFVPLGPLEAFAQAGALFQARFGEGGTRFGFAPFLGAGVRFAVLDWLALEVEGAAHLPITDHVLFGHELFPRAALLFQLGVGAEARF